MADDVVAAAADVLYRLPPDEFVARRTELARDAKAGGDPGAAAAIRGFARPTRAAWVLNLLARDSPDVVTRLLELGASLQAAQQGLDAASLRELSDQRRALVREVSREAFAAAGETRPSTSLAAEVQDTLTAAVLEPDVGAAWQSGTLLKATQASGFGPSGPELASVPKAAAAGRTAARPADKTASKPSKRDVAAEQRAAREQEQHRRRVAAAEQALTDARTSLADAQAAEVEQQQAARILREQLADAERALGDAGLAVREAKAAVRAAEKAHREAGR